MSQETIVQLGQRALAGLLVDETILEGDPAKCRTELGKRALDLYLLFERDPHAVTLASIEQVVSQSGSQIRESGRYLAHCHNVGHLARNLVVRLQALHPTLALPHPDEAFAMGLVHDLNVTFSDYAKGGQQSKELDGYILAEMHGWRTMAKHVALHAAYIEIAALLARGVPSPYQEAYDGMRDVFQVDNFLSASNIKNRFAEYMVARDNLPLLLLTVADFIENGRPDVSPETFEADFLARSSDIVSRYYVAYVCQGKVPSLFGQALVREDGLQRVASYARIVKRLLDGNPDYTNSLRESTTFFRS